MTISEPGPEPSREPSPTGPGGAIAVVDELFEALTRNDLSRLESLLAPDVVWLNTGLPTLRGRLVHRALRAIDKSGLAFSAVITHRAANDGVVLSNRTDILRIGPLRSVFPVRGTFVVREGKVAVWDDQFSLRQFLVGFFRPLP